MFLAVWEYQSKRAGNLPNSSEAKAELMEFAEKKRLELGINEKALKSVPEDLIRYERSPPVPVFRMRPS